LIFVAMVALRLSSNVLEKNISTDDLP
jgi:hypothetical protein